MKIRFHSRFFFSVFCFLFLHNYWLSKIFPISYELNQQASNLVSSFTSWQKFSHQHSNWTYDARLVQWSDQFEEKRKSNPKKNREFMVLKNSFGLYISSLQPMDLMTFWYMGWKHFLFFFLHSHPLSYSTIDLVSELRWRTGNMSPPARILC